jgi:phospho-N-acetylmuramoyl-pentapeptide-transferase
MLYYVGGLLKPLFGPARLLQSYAVLIVCALYSGFLLVRYLLPSFYRFLPHDRGREFTVTAEAARGKPTGSGFFFITVFVLISILFTPLNVLQAGTIFLTWCMMLTGYLDDRSTLSWGEYRKALLDLVICLGAAILLAVTARNANPEKKLLFWLPFITHEIQIAPWLFILITAVILWTSVNTTNCTDGVDGLSSTLVLVALLTMGMIFYFIIGHKTISAYLLVPHLATGASWAVITFAMAGVLMGYLWHNAFPSKVLMGDAGSRALGFYIGMCVMVTGNPFLILATSSLIFVNGGMGLLKVALKRFCHITIFSTIRFPLHDHMRVNHGWSATQVLIKFLIIQLLITVAVLGVFFKVR